MQLAHRRFSILFLLILQMVVAMAVTAWTKAQRQHRHEMEVMRAAGARPVERTVLFGLAREDETAIGKLCVPLLRSRVDAVRVSSDTFLIPSRMANRPQFRLIGDRVMNLREMAKLRRLEIVAFQLTADDVTLLAQLPGIKEINFHDCEIDDEALHLMHTQGARSVTLTHWKIGTIRYLPMGDVSPSSGALTVNPDGSYSYAPNAGLVGSDSLQFTVSDGAASDTGTVTIDVTPGPA